MLANSRTVIQEAIFLLSWMEYLAAMFQSEKLPYTLNIFLTNPLYLPTVIFCCPTCKVISVLTCKFLNMTGMHFWPQPSNTWNAHLTSFGKRVSPSPNNLTLPARVAKFVTRTLVLYLISALFTSASSTNFSVNRLGTRNGERLVKDK